MYSPKISEDLIPELYRVRKERNIPMTRLVDEIIRNALALNSLPIGKPQSNNLRLCVCESMPRDAA
jgi:hypothetical protein